MKDGTLAKSVNVNLQVQPKDSHNGMIYIWDMRD